MSLAWWQPGAPATPTPSADGIGVQAALHGLRRRSRGRRARWSPGDPDGCAAPTPKRRFIRGQNDSRRKAVASSIPVINSGASSCRGRPGTVPNQRRHAGEA